MSTKHQRVVDVVECGLVRRRLREILALLTTGAAATLAERLVHHFGERGVLAQSHGIQFAQLELHSRHQLVKAEVPVKPLEISLVDPERPADALFEA